MINHLSLAQRSVLLNIARRAGTQYLASHTHLEINPADYDPPLGSKGCSFVTLKKPTGELAGCIGSLEAHRPLVVDVAENSVAAATRDFRFPAMSSEMFARCTIEISVLTPQEKIAAKSKWELLAQITPHEDGLLVDDGLHRATFLPKVWEQLKNKEDFYRHLMQKAGLSGSYWSDDLCFYRYQSVDFSELIDPAVT